MVWDERRVVNGDMRTGDEEFDEYRSGLSYFCATSLLLVMRGIEWSFRAFADMQAVRLSLRARAVIKFTLQASSTLENTECK